MTRKLKTLCIALMAMALTAGMAPVAKAQFTSGAEHLELFGGGWYKFTAGAGFGAINCSVTYVGTTVGASQATQVLTPFSINTCSDSFGRTVDADNSFLTHTFLSGANKGKVEVSGGLTLTVTSGGSVVCTVVIKTPQTNNGISYKNLGGTNGVEFTTHSTNVINTTSGGFLNCGISNGEHTSGTYDGSAVIKGRLWSNVPIWTSVD